MQRSVLAIFMLLIAGGCVGAVQENPIGKVVELLSSLEAKITAEGEAEVKAYKEYADWCHDSEMNIGFEIKTDTKEKEDLEALISKHAADIEADDTSIEELSGSIASAEADLKAATKVREQEASEFAIVESELVDAVGTIERAVVVIEREMAKYPALLQKQVDSGNAQAVLQTLEAVIDSAGMQGSDRNKLVALVQNRENDDEADDALDVGAPAAAVYKSHGSSIVEVLEDLKEKAEEELAEARSAETSALHNFDMLKQSLEDQIGADSKDLSEAKTAKASSAEAKAGAEGDLAITVKALANAEATLATTKSDCMTVAEDHETSMKSRAEELKALAEAKEILTSSTGGAVEHVYSLLQIARTSSSAGISVRSKLKTREDLVNLELVNMIRKLAKEQQSSSLAQLASRISAVLRYGATGGDDPFAKVKGLITQLITKLEAEQDAETTKKEYCDKEMKATADKKDELMAELEKLTTKIDKASAQSAKLKEEVAVLENELADLSKTQAEMDLARRDEHSAFTQAKAELETGIHGVQDAIKVLREYYGSAALIQQPEMPAMHTKAEGAGSSIIGILEVCVSDFTKSLAEDTVAEEEAQSTYDKMTMQNKITKTMKEQDVKYKTAESASLDKTTSETTADKEGVQTELSAVLEYSEKLAEQCIAKPEPYEERARRRQAEIAGLKSALKFLEGEAFLQLRGIRRI